MKQGGGRFYRPELDVLRFVAFAMVFVAHAAPDQSSWALFIGAKLAAIVHGALEAGTYGVDLFFALSAYLITALLLREREQTGTIAVWPFYVRRALRIWPLYFTFLAASEVAARVFGLGFELPPIHLVSFLLFTGNWACALRGLPASVAGPLWSVSVEEQFYLLWPWIVRRWAASLRTVAFSMLAIASATRVVLVLTGQDTHPAIWCNALARLDPFAVGTLIATVRIPSWSGRQRVFLALAGFASIASCGVWGANDGPLSLVTYPVVACASGVLLAAVSGAHFISRAPLIFLGRISYGLYVFHAASIALVLRQTTRSPIEYSSRALFALALTIVAATVSYYLLERPFLRVKERYALVQSRPV